MSDYQIMNPIAGMQSIGDTSTTQNQVLGTVVQAKDVASTAYGAGDFIYLLGVASTVVGSFVHLQSGRQQYGAACGERYRPRGCRHVDQRCQSIRLVPDQWQGRRQMPFRLRRQRTRLCNRHGGQY